MPRVCQASCALTCPLARSSKPIRAPFRPLTHITANTTHDIAFGRPHALWECHDGGLQLCVDLLGT